MSYLKKKQIQNTPNAYINVKNNQNNRLFSYFSM